MIMERRTLFCDVILPLPLPNLYTYRIPFELNDVICTGHRVIVPFGKNKLYTAIVAAIHEKPPGAYQAKYIESVLDQVPLVTGNQLRFWHWMSDYYLCNAGDVMSVALPSSLKLSSETQIVMDPSFEGTVESLSDHEVLILDALQLKQTVSLGEANKIVELKSAHNVIKSLIRKGAVIVKEELKDRYKPRMVSFVELGEAYKDESMLEPVFKTLEKRAVKQLDMLMLFLRMASGAGDDAKDIRKSDLLKTGDVSALNALVKKGILNVFERQVGRISHEDGSHKKIQLEPFQEKAIAGIREHFLTKEVVLLHGITSSGKTELYTKLIEETLEKGKQVLYLLPEIALTAQLVTRLRKTFGDDIGVYHSRFNPNERAEIWEEVLSFKEKGKLSRFKIILGARSALFLPYADLGLVIIDEEHDSSYKQQDPAPRYQARDAAIFLAKMYGAKTVLGSATPSLESYYNARENKYGLVELNERFGGLSLPSIHLVDVGKETKERAMKSHFSPQLIEGIRLALQHNEQVILFQNRRGFAPVLECDTCGWSPKCVNCDVTLVYHKQSRQVRCHYCGYSLRTPSTCGACGDHYLKVKGFGTEKIEEEISVFFPEAKVARMDLDTTRSRYAYQQIIQDFEERKIDILVGTQMVAKGLDFDHVSLVGVLDADGLLRFPDFRAHERAFQLMEQVAGRAGRKGKKGDVLIQTRNTEHAVLHSVKEHDYAALYREELAQRKKFNYPPFSRLIDIMVQHPDADQVNGLSEALAIEMRKFFGQRILGPEFPTISRVRNLYRKRILIKMERNSSPGNVRKTIKEILSAFRKAHDDKKMRIRLDVDPV